MQPGQGINVSPATSEDAIAHGHVSIPTVIPRKASSILRPGTFSSAGITLPKVPVPSSPLDLPPQTSDFVQVAANPTRKLLIKWSALDGSGGGFLDPNNLPNGAFVNPPLPEYSLAYRLYWLQTTYQQVSGPQSFLYKAEVIEGMSQTDSVSISAELGVDVEGLSAALSVTFEHSITITTETKVSHDYEINVPAGKIGVWILWQLVEEIIAVDSSGKQIQYSGNIIAPFCLGNQICTAPFLPVPCSLPATVVTQGVNRYAAQTTIFDQ
jgi:hypothetical protein